MRATQMKHEAEENRFEVQTNKRQRRLVTIGEQATQIKKNIIFYEHEWFPNIERVLLMLSLVFGLVMIQFGSRIETE